MKRWISVALVALLVFSMAACSKDGEKEEKKKESSQEESGVQVETPEPEPEYPVRVGAAIVPARPGRVVSLAPSITEKIYDLGLEHRLMGVSDHCDYPAAAAMLPQYGTAPTPDMEALEELGPHVVLTVSELSADAMEAIEEMGAVVVTIPSYCKSLAELEDTYIALASVLEGRTTGEIIGEHFVDKLEGNLDRIASNYAAAEPLNALYLRYMNFTVATGDTLEGDLLERMGFVNIASEQEDWTFDPVVAESTDGRALFTSLDIIFMDENDVTIKDLEQSAFYKGLQATLKDWYIYIDAVAFERQSLRMLHQLERMVALQTVGDNPW